MSLFTPPFLPQNKFSDKIALILLQSHINYFYPNTIHPEDTTEDYLYSEHKLYIQMADINNSGAQGACEVTERLKTFLETIYPCFLTVGQPSYL